MLSKGGKVEYLCPKCGSGNIIKNDEQCSVCWPDNRYIMVNKNTLACVDCRYVCAWRERKKVSKKLAGGQVKVSRKIVENPFGEKGDFENPGVTVEQSIGRTKAKLESRDLG